MSLVLDMNEFQLLADFSQVQVSFTCPRCRQEQRHRVRLVDLLAGTQVTCPAPACGSRGYLLGLRLCLVGVVNESTQPRQLELIP